MPPPVSPPLGNSQSAAAAATARSNSPLSKTFGRQPSPFGSSGRSWLAGAFDQTPQYRFQRHISLSRAGLAACELDPTFVEAVEHADARRGIFHSLRQEQRFPSIARHNIHFHRVAKQTRKCRGDLVGSHAMWPFEFDHSVAAPGFLEQRSGYAPDISRRNHGHGLIKRL